VTLSELRDALNAYPAAHPCPKIEDYDCDDYDPGMLAFICAAGETGTVGEWLAHVGEVYGSDVEWTKGGAFHMNGDTEVTYTFSRHEMGDPLGPTFLRVLLGPVPVVLPDGCTESSAGRQFVTDAGEGLHLVFTRLVEGRTELEISADFTRRIETVTIHDKTFDWLRTGEVLP